MLQIGLITVLYRSDKVIVDFIKSLGKQTIYNFKIYFVDNSVNENSTRLLYQELQKFPKINFEHIQNLSNEGVAEGNNIGIKQALSQNCSHILLLNNDIVFEDSLLLEKIISLSEKNANAIIAPKIYYYNSNTIWYAGGYHHKFLTLGKHIGNHQLDSGQFDKNNFCTYAPTCFVLIPKIIFTKIGLMEKDFFAYYDDNDFMYRVIKNKFQILYTAETSLQHKVSSSTGGDFSDFYIYYSNRNKLIFIKRNYTLFEKVCSILIFFLTRSIKYFKYNTQQKKKWFKAFLMD